MNKISKYFRALLFIVVLLFVIKFYLWSKFLWLSIILIFIFEPLTLKLVPKTLKKNCNSVLYKVLKYSYIFFFPVLIAIFFRVFLFEIYFIPSSSMERTLSQGNIIITNKLKYGPILPSKLTEVPFGHLLSWMIKETSEKEDVFLRLQGEEKIKRHDIVVFKDNKKVSRNFVKRIIGLPGEKLQIVNSNVIVNELVLEEKANYVFEYNYKGDKLQNNLFSLSNKEYNDSNIKGEIERTIHYSEKAVDNIYPKDKIFEWTRDNYGVVLIPKEGMKVEINNETIPFYKDLIKLEKNSEVLYDSEREVLLINGIKTRNYVFEDNYFFVMGDNRHFSSDSRATGFVSEKQIQGKLGFIIADIF